MATKVYTDKNVLEAARERVAKIFDEFENIYISFSGGKDSSTMTHLVMDEARKRNRKVGLLIIDLEAQYMDTVEHVQRMVDMYKDNINLHRFCGELLMRNAVSNFEPRWTCWDEDKKDIWVREKPELAADLSQYDFYVPKMEFEEFMVLFGKWYGGDKPTVGFVGIRADESLHRYRAIISEKKGLMWNNEKWTTKISSNLFNVYPMYDWKSEDIWIYNARYPELPHNTVYDKMMMAGVKLGDQRLCQPYGDDQRKGLRLYHILEPDTWARLLKRVNGANSGALYIKENGNMTGYHHVDKPEGHTRESFVNLLLSTMPEKTMLHYKERFKKFFVGWKKRGYTKIPDEAPHDLEVKSRAPSWRRLVKTLLRNDYRCKGLGQTQPKSEAYLKYKQIRELKKKKQELENN